MTANNTLIRELAQLYGIQTAYYDAGHRRRQASHDSLTAVLKSMGAPLSTAADIPSALRERRQSLWQQMLEPVIVAWEGLPVPVQIRLPADMADAPLAGHLELETGEWLRWKWAGNDLPASHSTEVEGGKYVLKNLPGLGQLPRGYHRFILEVQEKTAEALVIAAPLRAYQEEPGHGWGAFLPLYALHSRTSWGSGDFSDLERLAGWVASMGGTAVATLPFLATHSNEPSSPYSPVSRLMWNELYIDVIGAPELKRCPSVRDILESGAFQSELENIRQLPLVDYPRQMALKRSILEELSRCCFSGASDSLPSLRRFAIDHPGAEEYARFRAAGENEKHGTSWRSWPEPLRQGRLRQGDYDEEKKGYHLYVQWLADRQLEALSQRVRANNVSLFLDLPMGVHPDSYDVWRNQELFVADASAGAPPDSFFTHGQNWLFPPINPLRLRQQNYRYFIDSLAHNLKYAGLLRIDHVMGLHRLFWLPKGMEAKHGAYVRYPAEELYAIISLESHRSETAIVGEDLGTVPPEVRPAMLRHGLQRMYIVQYEVDPAAGTALRPVKPGTVAGLNTHDMPPFAAFWQGLDIDERLKLGLLTKTGVRREQSKRRAFREALLGFLQRKGWEIDKSSEPSEILRAMMGFLGRSAASTVLVNLEDLWLETRAQNMPGTYEECPNWRRKARYSFEEFSRLSQVKSLLHELDRQRKQGSVNNGVRRQ